MANRLARSSTGTKPVAEFCEARLPELCRRKILSYCSPASFVALRQTSQSWRAAATHHVLQRSLSNAVGYDLSDHFEDSATYERAHRCLVRYEVLNQRRTQLLRPPVYGLHDFRFTANASQLIALRWGSHLVRWDLLDDRISCLHEGVNKFVFGADRSELFAVEEFGSAFLIRGVGSFQEEEMDLELSFPDITLGFSVNHETGYFAAGSWGGVGTMGNLFDPAERTDLPQAHPETYSYEAVLVDDGRYVLHTGLNHTLQLTPMHAPNASIPAPGWLDLDRLRRTPRFSSPDAILHKGGVAAIHFARRGTPIDFVLATSLRIKDMQPLADSNLWVTIDQNRTCTVWDTSCDAPQRRWYKQMRQKLVRLRLGSAPDVFLVQDEADKFYIFSWRETSAWFHGVVSFPYHSNRLSADVSEDGGYALLAENGQLESTPAVFMKRIAPRSSIIPFAQVDAFSFHDLRFCREEGSDSPSKLSPSEYAPDLERFV